MEEDSTPASPAAKAAAMVMADDSFKALVARAASHLADREDLPELLATAVVHDAIAEAARVASIKLVGDAREDDVLWRVIAEAFGISVPTAYARFTEKGREDSASRQRKFRARQLDGD